MKFLLVSTTGEASLKINPLDNFAAAGFYFFKLRKWSFGTCVSGSSSWILAMVLITFAPFPHIQHLVSYST